MRLITGLLFGFLLIVGYVHAQAPEAPSQPPLKVGLGFLASAYQGDLNRSDDPLVRFHPGFNLSLQFASQKMINPQVNAGFGKFVAQDREIGTIEGISPNTFVETSYFYADLRLKAKFLREALINPYFSLGLSLLGYTPRDKDGNSLIDNSDTRQEDETYGSITVAFPISVGAELIMSSRLSLGAEYTFRPTGSDYLDNIGNLGMKSGNDKLHSLLLSLYITFDPQGDLNFWKLRGRERKEN